MLPRGFSQEPALDQLKIRFALYYFMVQVPVVGLYTVLTMVYGAWGLLPLFSAVLMVYVIMFLRVRNHGMPSRVGDVNSAMAMVLVVAYHLFILGVNSPSAVWFLLIPIPALVIHGSRSGLVWGIISLASFCILFIKEASDPVVFPGPQELAWLVTVADVALALITLLLMFYANNWIRQGLVKLAQGEADRNRKILDTIDEGVLVIDGDGRILSANFHAKAMLDTPEILGRAASSLLPIHNHHDTLKETVELQTPQGLAVLEFSTRSLDAEFATMGSIVVMHDVTLHHQQLAKMKEARHEAEDANRAKSAFLAIMSHELRTPLNAIIGYTALLQEEIEEIPQATHLLPDLDRVHHAGRHLVSVIGGILDLSKLESGETEVSAQWVEVAALIQDVLASTEGVFHGHDVSLRTQIDLPPHVTVFADQGKLRQILINLVGNAFKFTTCGSVTLAVTQHPGHLCFEVIDTGPGIAPDHQETIFEPFKQIDDSFTRAHDGAGLGLAICYKFAQLMDATLALDSTLGHGSTFSLLLPHPPSPHHRSQASQVECSVGSLRQM